ncbi:hypothetical protein Misp01_43260 [Microtetraspora sp. NBRC 13810]|nr:hypothetical protein Misp01_43260 [Microtetraspora sp. NBRC 13810]
MPALWLAMVTMGLMAGLFYGFSIAVMPGLARADDHTFVQAMQRINESIENPVFFAAFFGAFVFTGAAAVAARRAGTRSAARWIAAALALYTVALLVTIGVNVPLNDELARAGDTGLAAARAGFEDVWVAANAARALACTLAVACLARAAAPLRRDTGT